MVYKKKILFEHKKTKLRDKWHLVENKRYHTPCLKKNHKFPCCQNIYNEFPSILPCINMHMRKQAFKNLTHFWTTREIKFQNTLTLRTNIVHAGDKFVIMFYWSYVIFFFDLLYLIILSFSVCSLRAFLMFLSCYYYWIFGSPRPTVCKLVFFHLHLASGLHLWKFPLASLQLHFALSWEATSCTCTI